METPDLSRTSRTSRTRSRIGAGTAIAGIAGVLLFTTVAAASTPPDPSEPTTSIAEPAPPSAPDASVESKPEPTVTNEPSSTETSSTEPAPPEAAPTSEATVEPVPVSDPTVEPESAVAPTCEAVDDDYEVVSNDALVVAAPGVLANDALCPEFDPATDRIDIVTDVEEGTLTLITTGPDAGGFRYQPQSGTDWFVWFTYALVDVDTGEVVGDATVGIRIYAVDCEAEADSHAPSSGDAYRGVTLLHNDDICADFDHIEMQTGPQHGTVTLQGGAGRFGYVSDAGYVGGDSFTYFHADADGNQISNATNVQLDVRADFVEARDDTFTTEYGEVLTVPAPGVLANDDVSGLPRGWGPTWGESDVDTPGIISIDNDGAITFTPKREYSGTFTIPYALIDNDFNMYDEAVVTITVLPPPCEIALADDSYAIAEHGVLELRAPGVVANDEMCGNPLPIIGLDPPDHGTLTLGFDGALTYTPDRGFVGTDSFAYTVQQPTVAGFRAARPTQLAPDLEAVVTIDVSGAPPVSTSSTTTTTPGTEPGTTAPPPTTDPNSPNQPTTNPGTPTTVVPPVTPTTPAPSGQLPATGTSATTWLSVAAGLLVIAGAIALTGTRRRVSDH